MVSTLLGNTRWIKKNQFASQLSTRDYIKVHGLALKLRVVQMCKSQKKKIASTKTCKGLQKNPSLTLELSVVL